MAPDVFSPVSVAQGEPSKHDSLMPEPMRAWNQTSTEYPRESTVAKVFEEVVATNPDAIAVTFGSKHLTYSELNRRANRLAHELRHMGVGPETMVGCCVERSFELIVAFVAVLKAGGAYVPLDPSYPKERFDFMLEDTNTPVMLVQKSLLATVLAGRTIKTLCVEDFDAPAGDLRDEDLDPAGGAESLAYVMYTSGSTGQPKGVMVENRAIVRLVRNTNYCRFGSDETFLQFAPVSFDASTLEIWGALLNGGRLVVMPPKAASLEDIGRVIRETGVTTLWLTSGLFNLMVEQRLEDLHTVRQLLAGGDVLSPRHVRMVLATLPNCVLINGYGPTENTTFTCCHVMRPGERVPESVPIGRPISNSRAYILNESMDPVLPGITGELYAAGDGVARGYLNNSEATAEKFLADPFVAEPSRMYRTGDLALWRNDGTIEFLGRIDSQVKILGYRIEPGEIELALRLHEGIRQVCVVPHVDESGSKRLLAYYIASGKDVSPRSLKQFLAGKIPPYMFPSAFVSMEAFPLSPNGKVDRASLPAPILAAEGAASADAPATRLEQIISDLWKRILRLERVGSGDNFFDLGGDSLLLVAVHSNLQKQLQLEIPVTDLFEFTTIRTLAAHLAKSDPTAPSFSDVQQQGNRQRDAFARQRERRNGGGS